MQNEPTNVPDEEPLSIEGEEEGAEEPLSLVEPDESPLAGQGGSKARINKGISKADKKSEFERPLNITNQGATRCRLFHSKVALSSLQYMENQINEWLDGEKIDVKHVGHVIGIMEGKIPEPNLVVIAWY